MIQIAELVWLLGGMSVLGAGGKLRRSFRRFGVWEEAEEENPSQVRLSQTETRDSRDGDMDHLGHEEVPAALSSECSVSFEPSPQLVCQTILTQLVCCALS